MDSRAWNEACVCEIAENKYEGRLNTKFREQKTCKWLYTVLKSETFIALMFTVCIYRDHAFHRHIASRLS